MAKKELIEKLNHICDQLYKVLVDLSEVESEISDLVDWKSFKNLGDFLEDLEDLQDFLSSKEVDKDNEESKES